MKKMFAATRSECGFTLFEVIVSVFIMGAALAALLGLLSGGARLVKKSADTTELVLLARKKMAEAISASGTEGVYSGTEDGWTWSVITEPLSGEQKDKLCKVTLAIVKDGSRDASYRTSALKAVKGTAQ